MPLKEFGRRGNGLWRRMVQGSQLKLATTSAGGLVQTRPADLCWLRISCETR